MQPTPRAASQQPELIQDLPLPEGADARDAEQVTGGAHAKGLRAGNVDKATFGQPTTPPVDIDLLG